MTRAVSNYFFFRPMSELPDPTEIRLEEGQIIEFKPDVVRSRRVQPSQSARVELHDPVDDDFDQVMALLRSSTPKTSEMSRRRVFIMASIAFAVAAVLGAAAWHYQESDAPVVPPPVTPPVPTPPVAPSAPPSVPLPEEPDNAPNTLEGESEAREFAHVRSHNTVTL